MENKKLKIIFLLLFIFITIVLYFLLQLKTENKLQNIKQNNSIVLKKSYNTIYNQYLKLSKILFDSEINNKEVIDIFKKAYTSKGEQKNKIRAQLFNSLNEKYTKLKKYNLKQLHFHLPNNESFLRMHRPNKYGDNLTGIRETVEYVNKEKKFIHGFEEGRIFNGYRFVFPIFDEKNNHIGSVETSFSILALLQSFKENFDYDANFLINKSVVDKKVFESEKSNYITSGFKDFYFEKNILNNIELKTIYVNEKNKSDINKKLLESKKICFFNADENKLITFLPILHPLSNKSTGYLVFTQNNTYINEVKTSMYLIFFITLILIILVLFIIYKNKISKKHLEDTIKKEIQKNREIEKQLFEQSKQAQMGEMIGNIAHQWRQPLNVISVSASGVKIEDQMETLNKEKLYKAMDEIIKATTFLSKTIDTFRNFLKQNNKNENIILQDRIDESLNIVEASLKNNYIELKKEIDYTHPIKTKLVAGELSQVLINILNNAKDAIKEKNIENGWIKITLEETNNKAIISIEDNALGVKDSIKDKIFNPYFTTKHQSQGTGLGLHMSYDIVTKHLNGKLYVKNTSNGAKFFIELPLHS